MKRALRILAAAVAMLMLLTACAPKELTFVGETPEGVFRAEEAVKLGLETAGKSEDGSFADTVGDAYVTVNIMNEKKSAEVLVSPMGGDASPEEARLVKTRYAVDLDAHQATVTSAIYRKANGDWYNYTVTDGVASDEPLWLKLTDPSPANVGGEKTLLASLAANDKVNLTLTMKDPTFYFTEEEENGVIWYIEAPLNVTFTDKSKRDAFRRQHPGGDATDVGEEEYRWTARALLKVQYLTFTPWKQFDDLLLKTFDQPGEYTLQLEEDGSVHSLYPL